MNSKENIQFIKTQIKIKSYKTTISIYQRFILTIIHIVAFQKKLKIHIMIKIKFKFKGIN